LNSDNHRVDFFNQKAQGWNENNPVPVGDLKRVIDLCRLEKGQAVLDIGTGNGRLVPFLLEAVGRKGQVVGVDPAEGMLAVARQRHQSPNLSFVKAGAEDLPLGDGRFDTAICYSVYPHFNDRKSAIAELKRVLKAGGLVAVAHTQGRQAINSRHQRAGAAVKEDHLPPASVVAGQFEQAGMETVFSIDEDDLYFVLARKPVYP